MTRKSVSLPSVRVTPEFRAAAESVLREGESLPGLMLESLSMNIERRKALADAERLKNETPERSLERS